MKHFFRLFTVVLVVFVACQVAANQSNEDSLRKIVYRSSKINLSAYKELLDAYSSGQADSVYAIAKRLLYFSIEQKNRVGENIANTFIGDYYSEIGEHSVGLEYLSKALHFYQTKKSLADLVEVYNFYGNLYFRKGEFVSAIEWYKRSIRIGKEIGEGFNAYLSMGNLGRAYIALGKADFGEKMVLHFADAARKWNKPMHLVNAYNILGGYYQGKEDYNLANNYFQEALKIGVDNENLPNIANSYNNIAITYFYEGKEAMAKSYFLKALFIRQKMGVKMYIAESYYNLGDWFYYNQQYDSAQVYYQKSYEVGRSGKSYKDMGDALLALSELFKEKKDFKKAYEYHLQYTELLQKQQQNNLNDELETAKFNEFIITKKKNQIIEAVKKQTSLNLKESFRKELILFTSVFILLVVVAIALVYFLKKEQQNVINQLETNETAKQLEHDLLKKESEELRNELDMLQHGLLANIPEEVHNVHFLCGSIKEKTRIVRLSEQLMFLWDANLPLSSSILLWEFLNRHKEALKTPTNIDDVLSQQSLVADYAIEWMLIDTQANEIRKKSGFAHVKSGRLLAFSAEDTEKKRLIVHSTFSNKYMEQLATTQQSIDEMAHFSSEMLKSLNKSSGEKMEQNFCVFYFS